MNEKSETEICDQLITPGISADRKQAVIDALRTSTPDAYRDAVRTLEEDLYRDGRVA